MLPNYGYQDTSMTDGLPFTVGHCKRIGFFGLFDDAPPRRHQGTVQPHHVAARSRWPLGKTGIQIAWSEHGHHRPLKLADGAIPTAWLCGTVATAKNADTSESIAERQRTG